MKKHFVTYYWPGSLVANTCGEPVEAWDVDAAKERARKFAPDRAAPYGFRFTTRERGPDDLDSKQTESSPMYYLGGTVETLEQVKARATDKDYILIANMEGNKYDRIVTNNNSWRWTQPLEPNDVVLEWPS